MTKKALDKIKRPTIVKSEGNFPKSVERLLFDSLDTRGKGWIEKSALIQMIQSSGIQLNDIRLQETMNALAQLPDNAKIDFEEFVSRTKANGLLIQKILQGDLVVPDFQGLCHEIEEIFKLTQSITEGEVADYIPQLKRVNPEQYGVSICTIDGQRFSVGDSDTYFCVQSTCKPINYCLALEANGGERVHRHVAYEPSGKGFNELTLNTDGLPHNPMINAGAIMACSLLKPEEALADRFDYVLQMWKDLSGGQRVSFNNAVYLSEKQTADRNFALGYFMREKKAFPAGTDLIETLDFYFQCCSIEVTAEMMSVIAGTLANGGICPINNQAIFHPETVKNCLSLMSSCGMYDYSGEFAFSIGIPAKSGVSGVLMIVIPNVMGICVWSPRLDQLGNSVRGIHFCKTLVQRFNFHTYDSLATTQNVKKDPRQHKNEAKFKGVIALCWASAQGDLREVQHLLASGVDFNDADYDGRTAMHLAASEGHVDILEYFIHQGAAINPLDRWGGTPLEDAYRHSHQQAINLLVKNGGKRATAISN